MSTLSGPKSLPLRNTGLIDRDERMRDVTDHPGGRKGASKFRSHRPRLIDAFKDQAGPSSSVSRKQIVTRSDPLSIRGAARPTVTGRLRRNAVSSVSDGRGGTPTSFANRISTVKVKALDVWREFVKKRWNAESRFLNLESMSDDELLKKNNIQPPGTGGGAREAAVIFKLASQLKPEVQTISLANNSLTGMLLNTLPHYLPNLVNLSLQNNKLRGIKDLDYLASRRGKMGFLRELILVGNPWREIEIKQGRGDTYRNEVARRFPSLELLDSEPVPQITFDAPKPSTSSDPPVDKPSSMNFPCEMQPSFITGVDGSIVSNFLSRFFTTLDSQRALLSDVYHPSATFSFSINTSIPTRARIIRNQHRVEWSAWNGGGGSRNLDRMGGRLERAIKSLHVGGEEAVKAMTALPATKHDIGGPPEKFCIDSFPFAHGEGMGLLLVVHGEFTQGVDGLRSFDRTFILAPAAESSRAKLNGWDVVILSDQWNIRVYSSHEAWKPGPMRVQAAANPPDPTSITPQIPNPSFTLPLEQQTLLNSIRELHRPAVLQICQQTGLNVKFAVDCLTGNEWDLGRAIANFNEVKGTLGREAFL